MFVISWRPLDGCSYPSEGALIYPKFAPRAHRGKSARFEGDGWAWGGRGHPVNATEAPVRKRVGDGPQRKTCESATQEKPRLRHTSPSSPRHATPPPPPPRSCSPGPKIAPNAGRRTGCGLWASEASEESVAAPPPPPLQGPFSGARRRLGIDLRTAEPWGRPPVVPVIQCPDETHFSADFWNAMRRRTEFAGCLRLRRGSRHCFCMALPPGGRGGGVTGA